VADALSKTRLRVFAACGLFPFNLFVACGLFLFNPDRVLRSMPKPSELVTEVDNVMPRPYQPVRSDQPQDWAIQSPKTPVSGEGFKLMQNMTVQQNIHAYDETGRWRLYGLIQKLC
jgi:hypothetical protein